MVIASFWRGYHKYNVMKDTAIHKTVNGNNVRAHSVAPTIGR
jgi:hypothetical protein